MAATFELEIATPERLVVREHVTEAQIPAENGMIGVLPDHAPLISALGAGQLSYKAGGEQRTMAVAGGFLEIRNNHVRVLADSAERAAEIDIARAEAAMKRAQERMALPYSAGIDMARALNAMKRAQARIETARAK